MFYNEPQDIDVDQWVCLLQDPTVTRDLDVDILRTVYEAPNHEITASKVALKLNLPSYQKITNQIVYFSKRVVKKTGITPSLNTKGRYRWWHVPFLGYETRSEGFPWIMRPELVMAFERVFPGMENSELVSIGEINFKEQNSLPEGAVSQVLVNRYERNRRARNSSIDRHGSKCVVCGFDFEAVYGSIGKNKIHVHHLKPLAEIQAQYEVDPIRDLRPVCPNCHLIIHSKKEPFTIEEVRSMIARQKLMKAAETLRKVDEKMKAAGISHEDINSETRKAQEQYRRKKNQLPHDSNAE